MARKVGTLAAAVALCAGVTGCASKAAPAVQHKITGADSPQVAAIGFDESSRAGEEPRFACLPGNESDFDYVSNIAVGERPSAHATRVGAKWFVTLRYPSDPLNFPRYEVRQADLGYCVSRVLSIRHPQVRPSSPAPHTGSATSAPPR
jgi:hypothetical protein